MKNHLLLMAIAVLGLAACHSKNSQLKDFIPGTYTNYGQSEFSVAYDTLLIIPAKSAEDIYLITHKTGFRRITGGKQQQLQHQVKQWTGSWDTQKQIMQVMQTGSILIFQPNNNNLLNNSVEYKKL